MAISGITARGSAVSNSNGTTLSMNPTADLTAGKYVVVSCASDNDATADGASTFHSVTDSKGNTWARHGEYTETDGAANDGTVVSIWGAKIDTAILTTDTITLTLGASKSDKIITCFEATVGTGKTLALEQLGVGQGAISASVTGMTSREYLLVGAISSEGEDSAKTPDADYTEQFDLITSTTGNLDVNQAIHVQTRVATLTSDTCTSTAWTFTNAMALLAALYEVNYNSKISGSAAGTSTTSATGRIKIPSNYTYYRAITIDNTKVAADLTDFPVLVSGTYTYLKTVANGGKVENANGYDIAFYENSDLDLPLKFEIEQWSATTGEFIAWVKVPNLANATDTTIYLAYGDSGISTAQETPSDAWDSNFKGVWHLPNGTSLTALDSTSNNNDGTVTGAVAATGKIGGGASFDGTGDYISHGNVLDQTGANPMTFSCWFKTTTTGAGVRSLITKNISGAPNTGYQFGLNIGDGLSGNAGKVGLIFVDNNGTPIVVRRQSSLAYNDGNWHYAVATYDGSKNRSGINVYVDGQLVTMVDFGSASFTGSLTNTTPFQIAARDTTAQLYIGQIDEARFAQIQRSAGWIETEYNNQNSPSTFYSIGSEVGGNPGAISGAITASATTSATIRAKGALATSITASATTSAVIKGYAPISGSTSGVSTVSADLTGITPSPIYGTSDGTSTALAALQAKGALQGSAAGTSTASGSMSFGLAGSAAGISTATAEIRAKGTLSGSVASTSTASGTIGSKLFASGTISGSSTASATITGKGQLSASITADSSADATIRAKGELSGSAAGTSTASAAVSTSLYGTASGTATVNATITAKGQLSGVINCASTTTASISGGSTVSGSISGTSTTSGRIRGKALTSVSMAGTSTATATLNGKHAASGTSQGSSTAVLYTNNTGNFFAFFS